MPPDAARETLYAVPTVAFGREAVVIVKVVLAGGVEWGLGKWALCWSGQALPVPARTPPRA